MQHTLAIFLSNHNGTLAWRLCWYSTTPSLGGPNTKVEMKSELRYSAVMYEFKMLEKMSKQKRKQFSTSDLET